MTSQRRGKVIQLERRAAHLDPFAGVIDKDPLFMTPEEKRAALERIRAAHEGDPEWEARHKAFLERIGRMTPEEKLEALHRIRAARLSLQGGRPIGR